VTGCGIQESCASVALKDNAGFSQSLRQTQVVGSKAVHQEAERFVAEKPELFVNRVVQHFQYLFGVKTADGLFPKLNELYLFVSEMENVTRWGAGSAVALVLGCGPAFGAEGGG
jgi:hypothetical protein